MLSILYLCQLPFLRVRNVPFAVEARISSSKCCNLHFAFCADVDKPNVFIIHVFYTCVKQDIVLQWVTFPIRRWQNLFRILICTFKKWNVRPLLILSQEISCTVWSLVSWFFCACLLLRSARKLDLATCIYVTNSNTFYKRSMLCEILVVTCKRTFS